MACAFNPAAIAQNAQAADRADTHARMKMSTEDRARFMADRMQEKLALSDDQHAKIMAVNLEVAKRRQALRVEDAKPDSTAFMALDQFRQEPFAAILTPAQAEQWKAISAQRVEMHSRGAGMRQRAADMPAGIEAPAATK